MTQFRTAIPRGVQDTLPAEMSAARECATRILRRFYLAGYEEVQTPSFEYFDVFAHGIGSAPQERMIKFFDDDGRILALRPDLTLPIARLVATRNIPLPFRACYLGNAYDMQGAYGRQREFQQAGIEVFGVPGPEADAEVILLAAEALQAAGLKDFQIELGQAEYFKGLLEDLGLTEHQEALRRMVDEKNMLDIELFFREYGGKGEREILELTSLYGGPEALIGAERLSAHPRCRAALDNLRRVYEMLCAFGVGDKISFDFGMLHSLHYYSGVIFRGMTLSLNQPLLSGGRYDSLVGEFGREAEATGFAMGIKRVLIALERESALKAPEKIAAMVSCENGAYKNAYATINEMKSANMRVEMAFNLDEEALEAAAAQKGAKAVYIRGGEGLDG